METKILLCCINPTIDSQLIDELAIYEIFKEFAVITNIKIFSRDVLIKAFVEVKSEFVNKCIEKTHMQSFAFGKLKVYQSHKDNITFDKDLATIINESANGGTSNSRMHSQKYQNSESHSFSYKRLQSNKIVDKSNKSKPKLSDASKSFENLDVVFDADMYIDYQNIKSVTDINSKLPDLIKYYPVSLEHIHNMKLLQQKDPETFKVIIVNKVNVNKINCTMLMNLFGCFGNVKKVLLNIKGFFALVEMENEEQALLAIKHLDKNVFFDNNIKVKSSKYNTVCFKTLEKEQNPDIQYLRGHYKYFRYKEGLQIKVNKPSNLLHITSLSDKFTSYFLCQLLSEVHEPSRIVKLPKKSGVSDMYLVEFESLHQAVEVLSLLHNKKVDGKIMKISFSHTDVNDLN